MSILIGPTAFATPPILAVLLTELVLAIEAVVVPSAKATLFDTNPLRDDDDDGEEIESKEEDGEGAVMCNLAGA